MVVTLERVTSHSVDFRILMERMAPVTPCSSLYLYHVNLRGVSRSVVECKSFCSESIVYLSTNLKLKQCEVHSLLNPPILWLP